MNNYYAPGFCRINFVVIPSCIELPWFRAFGFLGPRSLGSRLSDDPPPPRPIFSLLLAQIFDPGLPTLHLSP